MELYETIEGRRSIRKYKSDPVSGTTLNKILNAARLAPSWKNQQCWRFIIVQEEETKRRLAEALPEGNPALKAFTQAPVVVVLCANPEDSGRIDQKEYYLLDAGLAMQQMMLAAWAEGLGTCWVCWFDEEKAREACRIPQEYKVVTLCPLGVPERIPDARPRKSLNEIVFSEQWGNPME